MIESVRTPHAWTAESDNEVTISPSPLARPKYRADIDGLRAIAVLAVVGFHAFPEWVTGGYIGVDVFFVISGFLISTILFENLEKDTFTFSEFYTRRIKRIFPALLIVLVSCFAFGWFALLADEYRQLGKHIAGGAGFISNFLFLNERGYFDNAAETKPLLHLWSLGIEEQFYIVWPFLLWAAWKRRISLLLLMIAILAVSLVLSIRGTDTDAVATFYSPHTRFWELLCGGLLAWLTLYPPKVRAPGGAATAQAGEGARTGPWGLGGTTARNVQSVLGVLAIGYGIYALTKDARFPGVWALLPTVGAMLIISAGMGAWINRTILSNPVLVWFGLISFPLYLWHWPLLSFARVIEGETPNRTFRVAAVVASIVLAWLTYRLVEKPIRFGARGKRKAVALALSMLVVGCVGYVAYQQDGLRFRENARLRTHEGDVGQIAFHKYIESEFFPCTPKELADQAVTFEGFKRCNQSRQSANVDIAIVGDSHAEHLFIGIAEAAPTRNVAFYIKGTAPFVDNPEYANIYRNVVSSSSIKTVILTMHWWGRFQDVPRGSTLENEMHKTAELLMTGGKEVFIVDDIPAYPFVPEKCDGKRWLSTREPPGCSLDRALIDGQYQAFMPDLHRLVEKDPRIRLLEISKHLCDEKACSMILDGRLVYRDDNHLNIIGSKYIGEKLVKEMSEPAIRAAKYPP